MPLNKQSYTPEPQLIEERKPQDNLRGDKTRGRSSLTNGLGKGTASQLAETAEISGWSLEGARLQAAPYIVFKDLRHGWEAVPFQNSNAESFSASCSAVPLGPRTIRALQFAEKLIFGLSVASNEFSRFGPGCGFPTCCRRSFCCRTWYFSANCKAGTRCSPGGTLQPCPSHSWLSHTSTSRTAAAQHLCRAGRAWAPALHVKSPDPARQDRGWWKCGFG